MVNDEPVVDLCFPISGTTLPVDHGYGLLGALARLAPGLHGDEAVGVHPISGRLAGGRLLALTTASLLALRVPLRRVPVLLDLAGQELNVQGHALRLGLPTVRQLRPAPTLVSRLVVIKGFMEPEEFRAAAGRQLVERQIGGEAVLLARQRPAAHDGQTGARQPALRRTLRIRDREVVGFALEVTGLDAVASLRLQEVGLGGRRRFGCGVFVPWRV